MIMTINDTCYCDYIHMIRFIFKVILWNYEYHKIEKKTLDDHMLIHMHCKM
jgi:hypothetical protein